MIFKLEGINIKLFVGMQKEKELVASSSASDNLLRDLLRKW